MVTVHGYTLLILVNVQDFESKSQKKSERGADFTKCKLSDRSALFFCEVGPKRERLQKMPPHHNLLVTFREADGGFAPKPPGFSAFLNYRVWETP